MWQYWEHFKYTMKHKYYVFIECCNRGIPFRGLMHDMSKFRPSEFTAYANYFFNDDGTRKDELGLLHCRTTGEYEKFMRAWCHHQHVNDHHWEYWVIYPHNSMACADTDGFAIVPTPHALHEMVSDMIGSSAAQGNTDPKASALAYFYRHREDMNLHPLTSRYIECALKGEI